VVQVALVDAHVIQEDLVVGVQVALVDQDQLMDAHVILVVGVQVAFVVGVDHSQVE
jgi:hypothetical protein